jgi:thiamine-phosphate pyrophosphorylase
LLSYYITDRAQFPGAEPERRRRLLAKISEAARRGVDFIQLREKDLSIRQLEALAREAIQIICETREMQTENRLSRLLINTRPDVAAALRASGVHLQSHDISPSEVRTIWRHNSGEAPVISMACHSPEEVGQAQQQNADFAVFAPVFGKRAAETPPTGLPALRAACRHNLPVFALGGVTLDNASACLNAGASGVAAIRLFQENDIGEVVTALRLLSAGQRHSPLS